MAERYFVSDTHFGHVGAAIRFKRPDGSPLRPFSSVEEMDEEMVKRWNEVVKPYDKVYHCGDVLIKKDAFHLLSRLNGKKRLIMGNHDILGHEKYLAYFDEVWGVRVFVDQFILSHIPLHPDSVTRRFVCNVHGHLHAGDIHDGRYLNISVEHTDYRPLHMDEVLARIEEKRRRHPFKYAQDHAGPG